MEYVGATALLRPALRSVQHTQDADHFTLNVVHSQVRQTRQYQLPRPLDLARPTQPRMLPQLLNSCSNLSRYSQRCLRTSLFDPAADLLQIPRRFRRPPDPHHPPKRCSIRRNTSSSSSNSPRLADSSPAWTASRNHVSYSK